MSKVAAFPTPRQIEAEACAWIAQLDGGPPSAEYRAALRECMSRSPQHDAAIRRLSGLWGELNILTELAVPPPVITRSSVQQRIPARAVIFAGLCALAVAAAALYGYRQSTATRVRSQVLYSTRIGEQKRLTLGDRSHVLLNTDSRLQVDYSAALREVHLLQGEAYFDVAHDANRPFVVYAGDNAVRAVGTAFTVKMKKHDIEVVVTEGTVELSTVGKPDAPASKTLLQPATPLARIKAGQKAAIDESIESIQPIATRELEQELSWRTGVLSFSGDPLQHVVEEVSRYSSVTIVISDPRLRDVRIGGRFKVGDTNAMLEALQTTFGVKVERVGQDTVYLSAQ